MVQEPTIPHFEALVVVNKILGGKGRGTFKSLPNLFLLKSLLFYIPRIWPTPECALSLSFWHYNVPYQSFQMRYCGFLSSLLFEKVEEIYQKSWIENRTFD